MSIGTDGARVEYKETSAMRRSGTLAAIRPVQVEDLAALKAWDEDPDIIALMGQKFPELQEEEWSKAALSRRNRRPMAIETHEGQLIGEIELAQINWRAGTAEMRICIGEKGYWGLGFGHEALELLLGYAFSGLGLFQVYLRVFSTNERAIRLYERTGFRREAVLPLCRRRGDPSSVVLMSVNRNQWERRWAHA